MKNSLNNPKRPGMGLTDLPSLLRWVIGLAVFVKAIEELKKETEEKGRYAEKRRADLVNRLT